MIQREKKNPKLVVKMVVQTTLQTGLGIGGKTSIALANFSFTSSIWSFCFSRAWHVRPEVLEREGKNGAKYIMHGVPLACFVWALILQKWSGNNYCATVGNSE